VSKQHIILHYVCTISSKSLLVDRNVIVEGDGAGKSGLVDERDAVGKDVEQRGLACAGRTQNVGGLAGRAEAGTPFDNLLPASFEPVDGDLFLSGDHLDLEHNVAPAQFDRVFAEFPGRLDQLLGVNRFASRQRFCACSLSMDCTLSSHCCSSSFFLLFSGCFVYNWFNSRTPIHAIYSVVLSFYDLRWID